MVKQLYKKIAMVLFVVPVFATSAQTIVVAPYLQPGNASALDKEQKVLVWQTDSVAGNFVVTYQLNLAKSKKSKIQHATVVNTILKLNGKTTMLYRATLGRLKFDTDYTYTVSLNGNTITNQTFTTRTRLDKTRFAVLGDFGGATKAEQAIAKQIQKQKPQFVLTTGDNVYNNGLESEYKKNLFPFYNAAPDDTSYTSLMRKVPFYMILGNHDVRSNNLDKFPDGLAYFYYTDLPLNAPVTKIVLPVEGNAERVNAFKNTTTPRYPQMSNFSFDYGNVHVTCLDANDYANPLDADLLQWLRTDIGSSKADWKIVAYHHPAFNTGRAHYDGQLMRLLSPLFEAWGVDMVLNGHVHNYQRTVPLKFIPATNETGEQYIITPEGRVNGKFILDQHFDGVNDTSPEGIIYIVTGGGGLPLYDKDLSGQPELWKHDLPDNWVPFTVKFISDSYSYSMIETNGKRLVFQQIDLNGKVIDQITLTK